MDKSTGTPTHYTNRSCSALLCADVNTREGLEVCSDLFSRALVTFSYFLWTLAL